MSDVPWALNYFGELRHPVGLYRSVGFVVLCVLLWWRGDRTRPARLVWQALLGYSLVRLVADAYLDGADLIAGFRTSQVLALIGALVAALLLARRDPAPQPAAASTEPQSPATDSAAQAPPSG